MDKRYQVFVSSTYEDLKKERQEVMHALLELDCIPSGMELFPAANEDQWTVIKQVIDDCDYYLVIVAGRYGSLGPDGVSYTEMEYRYAQQIGKPCMAFVHQDPGALPANLTEPNDEGKQKLADFRALLQTKLCKKWSNPDDLGSVVSRSLIRIIKTDPAVGWVRADLVPDEESSAEIVRLRKEIGELQADAREAKTTGPEDSETLAQGEDQVALGYRSDRRFSEGYQTFNSTWNDVIKTLGPMMLNEATESGMIVALRDMIKSEVGGAWESDGYWADVSRDSFNIVIVQLRALGLIRKSVKIRSVKDKGTYWSLTQHGDSLMTSLLALRREEGE